MCSICGRTQKNFQPDSEEIDRGREEVQAGWTPSERECRARGPFGQRGHHAKTYYTIPIVKVEDIFGAEVSFRDIIE